MYLPLQWYIVNKYIVFNSRFIVNMPSRVHQRIINLSQSTNPFGFCDSFCDNAAFATHPGDADVDHLQSGYLTQHLPPPDSFYNEVNWTDLSQFTKLPGKTISVLAFSHTYAWVVATSSQMPARDPTGRMQVCIVRHTR